MTLETITNNKIASLNVIKSEKQAKADSEVNELVNRTLDSLKDLITEEPDSKGLFAIIYDKNNDPKILWGGDMDYVKMIGSLDLAKMELISVLMSNHNMEIED